MDGSELRQRREALGDTREMFADRLQMYVYYWDAEKVQRWEEGYEGIPTLLEMVMDLMAHIQRLGMELQQSGLRRQMAEMERDAWREGWMASLRARG